MEELRTRNARRVAWARAFLVVGVLVVHSIVGGSGEPGHSSALAANVVFGAAATVLLAGLNRRFHVGGLALAGALLDLAALVVAGWLASRQALADSGGAVGVAVLIGLTELVVLGFTASLPTRPAWLLVALAFANQLAVLGGAGMRGHDVAVAGFALAAFTGVAAWAGATLLELARSRNLGDLAARSARADAEQQRALAAELQRHRDALLAARSDAEALTALIVHDLKNPLATLLQYAALAEESLSGLPGADGAVDDLRLVAEEGQRMVKLIGDLLLVFRLERGALPLRREPVPVGHLLSRVAEGHRPRAERAGVALDVAAPRDLVASIDLDLTHRLLENLLVNALRHVGKGDRIELAAERDAEGVRWAVRNSGPPVPAEARGGLFERYASGGRREWHNAGMGLYLCRLVAEAHGGSCRLEDRSGWNVSFEATYAD